MRHRVDEKEFLRGSRHAREYSKAPAANLRFAVLVVADL
jgi:hypothetical protein